MTLELIAVVVCLWVLVLPAFVIGVLDRLTRPSRLRSHPDLEHAAALRSFAARPGCERRHRGSKARVPHGAQPGRFGS
jgi:hypothetical protein